MIKKTLLASGILLAAGAPGVAFAADVIQFDPDGGFGGSGALSVVTFDWIPGSSVSLNTIPTQQGGTFQVYTHGTLGVLLDGGGGIQGTAVAGTEITFVSGFGEIILNDPTPTVNLLDDMGDLDPTNDTYELLSSASFGGFGGSFENFFEIWFDGSADSNALAGTGYRDGTLILSGSVIVSGPANADGNFNSTLIADFTDVDGNGVFSPATDIINSTGWGPLDNFNGDSLSTGTLETLTVPGQGATTINVNVSFADSSFFITDVTQLIVDLLFNTTNVLPFNQTDPSDQFDTLGGTISRTGGQITLGDGVDSDGNGIPDDVNGLEGNDIVFQTDANSSFLTTVPEPGTMALLGLGLGTLGMFGFSRSRRRKA